MEKSNQKRLEEYLVGENGYLKSDISNGKVIMLSGKWGSGKTHFWQNEIATKEFKEKLNQKNSAYSYISLYGKSSIEEIENDIFGQIYFSAIGGENVATKTFSTFTKYSKRYGNLFSSFDFSKLADGLKEEDKDNKERVALERLKNNAILCFDDFERKSKDIDLNDLFGFITQLTLNFKCKVVIILNDDVFEGEEKDIFSNVKEKTVSKYLMYNPSIKDLFDSIFDNEQSYRILDEYRDLILKTIEKTEELNARIYIQILDNLLEWTKNTNNDQSKYIKYLIYTNINFILYHYMFKSELIVEENKNSRITFDIDDNGLLYKDIRLSILKKTIYTKKNFIKIIKLEVNNNKLPYANANKSLLLTFIENNQTLIKSLHFMIALNMNNLPDSNNQAELETFQKINNFIETGILIDE